LIDPWALGAEGALAGAGRNSAPRDGRASTRQVPDLIVGHGVLWPPACAFDRWRPARPRPRSGTIDADRQRRGAQGYKVVHPDDDERRDYTSIYDASGVLRPADTI
jgi:3-hydroxyethyl bacteriochlorophyllide a dehydrogenase